MPFSGGSGFCLSSKNLKKNTSDKAASRRATTRTTPVLEKGLLAAVKNMAAAAGVLYPSLWVAAIMGESEEARELLVDGANIEERGGREAPHPTSLTTPLQVAVLGGELGVVQLLLEHGALVNVKTMDGMTPVQEAANLGFEAVALLLLQHGADLSEVGARGRTALHWAALSGHGEVSRALLQHGANVLAETDDGRTAEDLALAGSHFKVLAILRAEAVTRVKCVAFAMGHHGRLGVGSLVETLEPEVLRMVLNKV